MIEIQLPIPKGFVGARAVSFDDDLPLHAMMDRQRNALPAECAPLVTEVTFEIQKSRAPFDIAVPEDSENKYAALREALRGFEGRFTVHDIVGIKFRMISMYLTRLERDGAIREVGRVYSGGRRTRLFESILEDECNN